MSRRGRTKPGGVQLFPFLDVLISTMGALIVLLHVFASQGQAEAKKVEAEQLAKRQEQEVDADFYRWRAGHLREARDKTEAQLAAERLKLSHVEDHQRRLEDKLKQLQIAAAELERAGTDRSDEREKNAAELAATQEKLAAARAAVDAARNKGKFQAVNYSVVPFEGRNGTQRRPVYIECADNKIILQPEGVELTPADFIGYFGPGNPLASALRAQREYFAKQAPNGKLDQEPYPLLLVRPEGVAAYYAARAALDSWGSEFGYELIGSDWNLKFPPSDAKLAELTEEVVAEARQRQREYILSSPEVARRRNKPVYHAKSHGGFAQEPGTGDGPNGDGLGAWSGRAGAGSDWSGTGGSGSSTGRGSRGFDSAGGTGDAFAGEAGDDSGYGASGFGEGGLGEYAPDGVGGGDPYSEPGEIGPQMTGRRGGTSRDGMNSGLDGRAGQDTHERYLGEGNSAGEPGGITQQGPYGRVSGASTGSRDGYASSNGAQGRSGPGGASAADGQPPGGNYTGQGKPSDQTGGSIPGSAQGTPGGASAGSPGSASPSAGAMSAAADPGGQPTDMNSLPSISLGNHAHPQAPKHGGGQKMPQSMAATRGAGWGLSESSSRAIGASRPILVQCFADKLVIVPESRLQSPREIPLGERTQDAMDELVSGVWDYTKVWGTAGRGVYWKPTLVLDVAPGADVRFREIQALLDGSGLDIERRGQAAANGNRPAGGQPSRPAKRK